MSVWKSVGSVISGTHDAGKPPAPPLSASIMAVGVLALQGSFNEHMAALRRLGVTGVEVRKPSQLESIEALIIPGGESTTMAKLANYHNLFPALRNFVNSGKPVWGTCAGLIFLANKATGQKLGGQELIGGLDCTVHRNFFGSQVQSFETELAVPKLAEQEGGSDRCRGVFIRAPAILKAGPDVEVLADYTIPLDKLGTVASDSEAKAITESLGKVIVAVRQRNILGTAFHPELTSDIRWHSYFLKMRKASDETNLLCLDLSNQNSYYHIGRRPSDLPIFE